MEMGVNHIRNASYVRDVCIKLWRKGWDGEAEKC